MIGLAVGGVVAVALVAVAVHLAATPWSYPVGLGAGAVGCLLVAFDGRGAR